MCANVEWYSLVLCLYLWSQVVSHVPCALKVPDHVLELLVVNCVGACNDLASSFAP